jgi:hypothetical protein
MVSTPRINWFFFVSFIVISIAVFVGAIVSPSIRDIAYAPLRDLILPPPSPINVTILYSTEKEAWLNEVVTNFEASGVKIDGHPVKIQLEKMGSWEINSAVMDGSRKPVIISPASFLQIAALQDSSTTKFGKSLVNPVDTSTCRSVLKTPLVLVAWKERAEVLWGQQPGASLWKDLNSALVNPAGWAAYNHPDWGYVKFEHTDPLKSNSGFMTILLMSYGYFEKTSNLTNSDILSNPDFQKWFLATESSISQFDESTGPLMDKMITYGPSTLDIVTVYEATAIEQADNAVGRYGELRVYYPPASIWSDHPFCVLNADWVTPQQTKAATLFIDYLTQKPSQELALLKYGFRPVDPSIKLEQPGSPFDRYAANGFKSDLSNLPTVEIPAGNVLNTLREFWSRNVSR